jgi:glutamyl-tRNA synthetase
LFADFIFINTREKIMIRTRFAPSPTGFMHVGNLRTALYEYLIAKSNNGKFILRIEDTDQNRFVESSEKIIYDTLKITGLKHDEGPDIGGEFGPYVQSQRKNIYLKYGKKLIADKKAYYCFCDKERLDELKAKNLHYDRKCLALSNKEIEDKINSGVPYVIRQFIPEGKSIFNDKVYGEIEINNSELDDQILIKSDGMPTYNFANVVDDHLMKITHVVRGCEYLSSTPKYNLLYQAFNWEIPIYIHLPLILGEDGEKLSKRNGSATFQDLINKGFLSEAIINYIALLGWSPDSNEEIFSLSELEKVFNIKNINKSPAIFDLKKLCWMNGKYIKLIEQNKFYEIALPYLKNIFGLKKDQPDYKKLAAISQTRINLFDEINILWSFINNLVDYDANLFIKKKFKTTKENSCDVLKECLKIISKDDFIWKEYDLRNILINFAKEHEIKNGQVFWPMLVALSGSDSAPCGATEIAELLGRDESIRRIKFAIDKLSLRE